MLKHVVVVGSTNLDFAISAGRNPDPGETVLGTGFEIFTGGKGANQAIAAARLGHRVCMIGKLGSDVFSAQLLKDLMTAGVDTDAVDPVAGHSGVAFIVTVESGQNSIIVVPGANSYLLPQDIEENRTLIASAGVVLTQMEIPPATTEALVELTWSHGVPLILDPTPARYLQPQLLRKVAWITPNETEAQLLGGCETPTETEAEMRKLAEHFLGLGPRNVLLKLGERGAYIATQDGERTAIPAYAVKPVDTTGAGDAFNGAFAVALARGVRPVDAARFASAAAAVSVTRRGAAPSMPTQADVDYFCAAAQGGIAVPSETVL